VLSLVRGCRLAAVAAFVACTLCAGPAAAFELFGVRLWGEEPAPPPPGAVTADVTFDVKGDGGLTNKLRNASILAADAQQPFPGSAAIIAAARRDYKRLLGVLYTEGRYDGVISITIDGREAADVPLDVDFGDTAEVVVAVEPGPVYDFGRVDIDGRPGTPPDDDIVPPTPEEIGLAPGLPALSTAVVATEAALVGRWRELGHPKAAVVDQNATAYHDRDRLDVAIAVEPGPAAVFGDTTVRGAERMDPVFVAYYAGIEPGEPFDPDDIERARDQLRRLDVFRAVRIVEGDTVGPDGRLPMEIQVAERKRRVFGFGIKYSTLDGTALEGYWRHRNLFGRAEKLSVEGRVGGIDANDPEDYTYRTAVTFLKPGVVTPFTDLKATLYAEQVRPDTYRARTIGSRVGILHRPARRWSVEAFGSLEAMTIDRTTIGDGDFFVASLPLTVAYDGTDNELNPTRGFKVAGNFEPFYEAVNGNVGAFSEASVSAYYPLAKDRLVLAARAAAGSIGGAPLQEVPASRLYFAGGGGSIRGYPYRGVGPVRRGEVIGGRSYFVGSVEARASITPKIGVVPFVDFGNAFIDSVPDFSERLRFGAGVGLRYNTGLGPLRFDLAFPLDPLPGDPDFAVYLGLGQAF